MRQRIEKSTGIYVGAFDPQYAVSHNLSMEHDISALLGKMLEALPDGQRNQTALARRLSGKVKNSIQQPDVSRWIAGSEPKGKNYQRILTLANELGVLGDVRSEDVAAGLKVAPTVRKGRIAGYVGASSEKGHFYTLDDGDFDEFEVPPGSPDQTVALEIKGKSFGQLLETWLVLYDDVRSPVEPDLYGHVCVIGLADDRILLKKIVGNGRGGVNLLSNTGQDDILDAKIEWAAKVTDIRPRHARQR